MTVPAAQDESALIIPVELPVAVRRLRDRMDPAALLGVPAHVTLLYPFLPPSALDEQVRRTLERIVGAEAVFAFTLSGPGRWPNVVYLTPEPDAPFRRLTGALVEAFPEQPPYGGTIPVADLVPHLTIAHDTRSDYLAAAEHALPGMLPIRDVAREAWLIVRRRDQEWTTRWRLALGTSAAR